MSNRQQNRNTQKTRNIRGRGQGRGRGRGRGQHKNQGQVQGGGRNHLAQQNQGQVQGGGRNRLNLQQRREKAIIALNNAKRQLAALNAQTKSRDNVVNKMRGIQVSSSYCTHVCIFLFYEFNCFIHIYSHVPFNFLCVYSKSLEITCFIINWTLCSHCQLVFSPE